MVRTAARALTRQRAALCRGRDSHGLAEEVRVRLVHSRVYTAPALPHAAATRTTKKEEA